jgi:hypothetical protein
MKNYRRIRLSLNLTLIKVFCFIAIASCVLLLIKSDAFNTQDQNEFKFLLILTALIALYSFIMPITFYDESNLYIKKFAKKEIIIPLMDIISITERKFSTYGGISTYRIEYLDASRQIDTIRFRAKDSSRALTNFIDIVGTLNPSVKIVTR